MNAVLNERAWEAPIKRRKLEPVPLKIKQIRKSKPKTKKRLKINVKPIILVSLSFVFLGLLILNLMGYNEVSIAQREIRKINSSLTSLKAEEDYYKMQISPYISPDYIAKQANERLGMLIPEQSNMMFIDSENGNSDNSQLAKSLGQAKEWADR